LAGLGAGQQALWLWFERQFEFQHDLQHDPPFTAIEIPYEGQTLPGYYSCQGPRSDARPTVVLVGGYDSYCEEGNFLLIRAALERGLNAVTFDGPGQGQCLRRQRLYFGPDWEMVVKPALDYIANLPGVDRKNMILVGRSFAGYLAPRATAFDHRSAALIADPGLLDLGQSFEERLPLGTLDAADHGQGRSVDEQFEARFTQDPMLAFFFRSRMAAHGVSTVGAYIREMTRYSLRGLAEKIECPTLVTTAGGQDPMLRGQSKELYDSIKGPKDLIEFSAEEGAGDHCEGGAPSRFYHKVFDRLEELMGTIRAHSENVVIRMR
jgi:alpha-beta hydrolase superfamily lysophospholipase